jgi:hypothetical protein
MAHTNYQLLNTLGLTREGIGKLLEPSFDYLQAMLNKSPFLRYQINMTTDHATIAEKELPDLAKYRRDTVLDMSCRTPLFEQTEFYKSFRSDTTKYFKKRLKKGRVAVCGNYEVLFGNAYEFLVALTDEDYEPTDSFSLDDGQVCTVGFAHGDNVLCARSPHITMGNLYLAENVHCYDLLRYFNLTPNIICVNAIESNIQQRLNGCDYDSDSMLVTNDPWIIAGVTSCYNILKVPVCKAEPIGKTDYENTPKSLAKLDQTIAKNKIGEIVNLSQFLNCLLWDSLSVRTGHAITFLCRSIMTSAFSRSCREWRSIKPSVCTPPIPQRYSPVFAITVRTSKRSTAAISQPSTSLSWEMRAPTLVKIR